MFITLISPSLSLYSMYVRHELLSIFTCVRAVDLFALPCLSVSLLTHLRSVLEVGITPYLGAWLLAKSKVGIASSLDALFFEECDSHTSACPCAWEQGN